MNLAELDKRHVWHPFTQMQQWLEDDPLVIERGEGNYLLDLEGNRYLDGVSSLWTNLHGHGRPELLEPIRAQLDRLAHSTLLGLANPPSILLAERLARLAPAGLTKVFYSDNGSTAVEVALKLAFQCWQQRGRPEKRRFVHLEDSYHGDTLGAVAVGGIARFHEVYGPLLLDTLAVPTPAPYRRAPSPEVARRHALEALEKTLSVHSQEIAAFILEPLVQGAGGILVHPPGYLRGVADLCRAHDVFLIADEVATGFGRTGTLFACEQEQVSPDFLCLAKGITGGLLPLAATLTTEAVYEAFLGGPAEGKTFYHGHTYTGNPLACAAGVASLDLFEKDRVLENLPAKTQHLTGLLRRKIAPHRHVGDVRQRGFMVGIELVAERATAEPFAAEALAGARVCRAARAHGVLVRPLGDVVVLMPPLSITLDELDLLVGAVARALDETLGASAR
jgi:adenosylmethionine---8-amino-7-oxononanoate aminotransferase